MEHAEGRFEGAGGADIRWQAWLPGAPRRGAVVIAHGAAEHSGRYAHVGARLAAAGYAAYALDHRGHGRSSGRRAYVDRMARAVEDLDRCVAIAAEGMSRKPFLLGHSMGGALALAYAAEHQDELSGLILSGPVAVIEAATPLRLVVKGLSVIAPALPVYKVDASLISRDAEVVRAYRADPLVSTRPLPARTVAELASVVARFHDDVPALRLPLLVLHGSADGIAAPAGSRMVHARAGSSDKTLDIREGLYHEILNEPEGPQVLDDVVAWLDARAASPEAAPAPGAPRDAAESAG